MKRKILRFLDKFIGPKLRAYYQAPSMEDSFQNLRRLGFMPRFIIDVGAFEGEWTKMVREIYPKATVLMLEAQESKRRCLQRTKALGDGKVDFRMALMGPHDGQTIAFNEFDHAPTASSILRDSAGTPTRTVEKTMRSIDAILASDGFPLPDLIKLDVQGYELEVLKGGIHALAHAEVVLLEASIIELYQNSPLLHDVVAFMADHGFQTYDICSLLRRPLDRALCQIDLIFVRNSSPLWSRKTWS